MVVPELSDEQIAAMSEEERRALIQRLHTPRLRLPRPEVVNLIRRARLALMVGGCLALIPWMVYLGLTLPDDYQARNWSAAWIGFDIALVLMMATCAYLGWRRRVALILPAFGTGMLLLVDAWFDIITAEPDDLWTSIGTALLGEIPLALLQISGSIMMLRYLILAHPLKDPVVSPLRARLPF